MNAEIALQWLSATKITKLKFYIESEATEIGVNNNKFLKCKF